MTEQKSRSFELNPQMERNTNITKIKATGQIRQKEVKIAKIKKTTKDEKKLEKEDLKNKRKQEHQRCREQVKVKARGIMEAHQKAREAMYNKHRKGRHHRKHSSSSSSSSSESEFSDDEHSPHPKHGKHSPKHHGKHHPKHHGKHHEKHHGKHHEKHHGKHHPKSRASSDSSFSDDEDYSPKPAKTPQPEFAPAGDDSDAETVFSSDEVEVSGVPADELSRVFSDGEVVMFSGCQDVQTSADVSSTAMFDLPSDAGPAGAGGACTNALLGAIHASRDEGKVLTYIELLERMRRDLKAKGFKQVPQLSSTVAFDLSDPIDL
eukprot:GHVN01049004.1.p1 GENE.GHVN01049004.1~~GHVN01049004.1.p1  ORF type:complete len:336 (+),score=47.70 GHVN01049004.1:49-1008(+)